jgi:hypothetical protein
MDSLVVTHQERLAEAEKIIEREISLAKKHVDDSTTNCGVILADIRDHKLYAPRYKSFTEYLDQRWGKTDRWARQIISVDKVRKRISKPEHACSGFPPLSFRAARELAKAPEAKQVAVLEKTIEDFGVPTEEAIAKTRKGISGGITFDPAELDAATNEPPPKSGAPKVDPKVQREAVVSLDKTIRALHKLGLYDRWMLPLGNLRMEIKELAS